MADTVPQTVPQTAQTVPETVPRTPTPKKEANPLRLKLTKPRKQPTKPAEHPKYSVMIEAGVASLKERGGSSRHAILKYVMASYKVGNDITKINACIKTALKAGVKSGTLKQTKGIGASGSFRLGEKAASQPEKPKAAAKKPKKPEAPKKAAKSPAKKAAAKPKMSPKQKAAAAKPKKAAAAKPKKAAAAKPKKAAAGKPKKATKSPTKKAAARPRKTKAPKKAAAKKAA